MFHYTVKQGAFKYVVLVFPVFMVVLNVFLLLNLSMSHNHYICQLLNTVLSLNPPCDCCK